jgi:hypothetical protein
MLEDQAVVVDDAAAVLASEGTPVAHGHTTATSEATCMANTRLMPPPSTIAYPRRRR